MDGGGTTRGSRLVAGRYRLLEPVGSGGMGVVWRAEDERLGRLVAVKEVRPPAGLSDAEHADLRERTLREARAAARLSTPGAVAVHDVVESDGRPYVVMELLQGQSLAARVAGAGPLPPDEAARVGLSLLATLTAAHRAGILHRDVKPANVVLTDEGRVVLTDFGIAKTAGDPQLTSTGVLLGSPAYLPPERARGREAGPASDLYALGATLFTAVEGHPPFTGPDAMATLLAVASGERQPMRAAGPLAPALEALLDPDPDRRPGPEDCERLLRAALAGSGPSPTPPSPAPGVPAAEPPAAERTLVVPVPVPAGPPPGHAAPQASRRPPVAPAGRPTPPPRRGRGAPALALAALVAVLLLGGGALLASRGEDLAAPGDAAAGPGTATGTAEGTVPDPAPDDEPATTPAPEATPAAGTPAPQEPAEDAEEVTTPPQDADLPEGWTTYTDPAGWSLAHPPGWRAESRDVRGQRVLQITSPEGGGRYIRVSDDGTAGGDPVERWRAFASEFAARNPSYREVGITEVEDYRYTPAADWEFRYSSGGDELHVVDRMFFDDDRAYAVLVQGQDAGEVRDVFDDVVESFRAAGDA